MPSATAAPRRVHFHPNAKENDGLSPATKLFMEYMKICVFRKTEQPQRDDTSVVHPHKLNVQELVLIWKMLTDLLRRCDRSRKGRVPILPRGGNTGYIVRSQIPYLISHVVFLEKTIDNVRARIMHRVRTLERES